MKKISKRKLESYKRAEMVCQELRHQIANNGINESRLCNYAIYWLKVTGNIKFELPKEINK